MKKLKDIPPMEKDKAIEDFINGAKDTQINKNDSSIDATVTSPQTETEQETATSTEQKPQPNTPTVTDTDTSTVTLLDTLIKPSENYVRMISYVYEYQSEFVKKMAKKMSKGKRKVKESEIVRIALDYLIKNIEKE